MAGSKQALKLNRPVFFVGSNLTPKFSTSFLAFSIIHHKLSSFTNTFCCIALGSDQVAEVFVF